MRILLSFIAIALLFGCASAPANRSEEFNPIRGKRYVIYVVNDKNQHTEAGIEIENRIKSILSDRGLLVVDFDSASVANFLKNDGGVAEGQAKRVASNADLIVTGRYVEEHLTDDNINKAGSFRSRLRASFAITETVSAIEKGRIQQDGQELANTFESATMHAAIAMGDQVGSKIVEKLLYIYR